MSDKKYISPEHAIRNILELKSIGHNVQTANAFFKPIGVISPPKGEEHVDGNADKIRAARNVAKERQSVTMAEEEQLEEKAKAATMSPTTGLDAIADTVDDLVKKASPYVKKYGPQATKLLKQYGPMAAGQLPKIASGATGPIGMAAQALIGMVQPAGSEQEREWELNVSKRGKPATLSDLETPSVVAARKKAETEKQATIDALKNVNKQVAADSWAQDYSKTKEAKETIKRVAQEKAERSAAALDFPTTSLGDISKKKERAETSAAAVTYPGMEGSIGLGDVSRKSTKDVAMPGAGTLGLGVMKRAQTVELPAGIGPDVKDASLKAQLDKVKEIAKKVSVPAAAAADVVGVKAPAATSTDVPATAAVPKAQSADISSTEQEKKLAADAKAAAAAKASSGAAVAGTGSIAVPRPADVVATPAEKAAAVAATGAAAKVAAASRTAAAALSRTATRDRTRRESNKRRLPFGLPGFTPGQSTVVGGTAPTFGVQHHRHMADPRRGGFDTEVKEESRYDIEAVPRPNSKDKKNRTRQAEIIRKVIEEQKAKKKKETTVVVNPKLNDPDPGSN